MRRFLISAAAAVLAAVSLVPAAQAADLEKENVTLAVGGRVALHYLPLNIAEIKVFGVNTSNVFYTPSATLAPVAPAPFSPTRAVSACSRSRSSRSWDTPHRQT